MPDAEDSQTEQTISTPPLSTETDSKKEQPSTQQEAKINYVSEVNSSENNPPKKHLKKNQEANRMLLILQKILL